MFHLVTAASVGLAAIRLRFSEQPRVVSSNNVDDALNPENYAITGESTNFVTSVIGVDSDPLAVDLSLVAPLTPGTWHVAVSNVLSETGAALTAPTSLSVPVSTTTIQSALAGGAVNDDVVNVLRKFLNPALKGPGWDSMLAALAAGDRINADNAKLAFNQLWLSTASGIYLDRRASDQGIKKPAGVMMSDDLFRQLAIVLKTEKLTQEAILEVLEVFYGPDAVRASMMTDVSEPYALEDGDDLQIRIDGREGVTVTFARSEFSTLGAALAIEVAAAITRALRSAGSQAFALSVVDPATGTNSVRIYSGRLGIASSVQIVGGRAQRQLLFPRILFEASGSSPFANWGVSLSPTTPGNVRFEMVAGGIYDLSLVRPGDLVYIFGGEFEATNNVGVFTVQDVQFYYSGATPVQWFEITNPDGTADGSISQTGFADLMFFRPVVRTIHDNPRRVVVAQVEDAIDVVIPATTQAVSRYPGIAAYGQVAPSQEVTSLVRGDGVATATLAAPHGLSVGDHIIVDGVVPTGAQPSITAGSASGAFSAHVATGTADASLKTTASEAHTFQAVNHKVVALPEGMLMVVGGQTEVASVLTNIANPAILEITSETTLADGAKQQHYRWTDLVTRSYHIGHRDFAVSVLADGRVLATGGSNNTNPLDGGRNTWDLFTYTNNPVANNQTNGTLPLAMAGHAQVSLPDGSALVFGGLSTVDSYYFNQNTLDFTLGDALRYARWRHGGAALLNGDVLAIGGQHTGGTTGILNTCERLTGVETKRWRMTGVMSYARYAFATVRIPDGRVVVLGGLGYNPTQNNVEAPLATCEIYDPITELWSPLPRMSVARSYPVAAYIPSKNAIMVAGGAGNTSIEILDLATMTWSRSVAALATGLGASAGAVMGTDTLVVIGGTTGTDTAALNYLVVPAQDTFRGGRLNGEARVVSVPSPTTFTFDTESTGVRAYTDTASGVTITPVAAAPAPAGIPGPFIYEPKSGVAVTATEATVTIALSQDQRYRALIVDDTSAFPDAPGYLAFNFGRTGVVGPVRYLGRISSTELALDAGFKFPHDVAAGTKVVLLRGRGPFEPPKTTKPGSFYVTGSAAGRVAAQDALQDTIGAGLRLHETISYPGDVGLGGSGSPTSGTSKLSDAVSIWAGDNPDAEVAAARTQS